MAWTQADPLPVYREILARAQRAARAALNAPDLQGHLFADADAMTEALGGDALKPMLAVSMGESAPEAQKDGAPGGYSGQESFPVAIAVVAESLDDIFRSRRAILESIGESAAGVPDWNESDALGGLVFTLRYLAGNVGEAGSDSSGDGEGPYAVVLAFEFVLDFMAL